MSEEDAGEIKQSTKLASVFSVSACVSARADAVAAYECERCVRPRERP